MVHFMDASISQGALGTFFQNLYTAGVQLHAIELFEQGECRLRWDVAPYRCTDKREIYSLSKSFTSTAAGVAYDRGMLRPQDAVLDYFPEYRHLCVGDERWNRLTVGHVLSMNTGHSVCVMPQMAFAEDGIRAFFESPLTHDPGTFFAYNTGASCLAAEIVHRATGETVPDLLAGTVFSALGIEDFFWDVCADGRCQGGMGLRVSCDDIAKLGLLYLNEGQWEGRQILSREWVRMASSIHSDNEGNGTPDWSSGYGFQFWRNHSQGYRGDGAFGQLCVILPESGRVVAVMAECTDMNAELEAVWTLLRTLHDSNENEEEAFLPKAYAPKGKLDGKTRDTGWLKFQENPAGFTKLRVQVFDDEARVCFCNGTGVQVICAPEGNWKENVLCAKEFFPTLWMLRPRNTQMSLRFAAAAHISQNALVVECRSLNSPHAFEMRFTQEGEGVQMELASSWEVFGAEKTMHAVSCR